MLKTLWHEDKRNVYLGNMLLWPLKKDYAAMDHNVYSDIAVLYIRFAI
jgi:hypothetical protein